MTPDERKVAIERVLALVANGHLLEDACRTNHVGAKTWRDWQVKGETRAKEFPELVGLRERTDVARVAMILKLEEAYLKGCCGLDANGKPLMVQQEDGTFREAKADMKAIQWFLAKRHWRVYDQAAVIGHKNAQAAREANVALMNDVGLQDRVVALVKDNPQFAAKMKEALDARQDEEDES